MFDRLEDLVRRYEELMLELNDPSIANDQNRFRKLMKEQSDLAPIVEAFKEYKASKETVEESLAILEEEAKISVSAGRNEKRLWAYYIALVALTVLLAQIHYHSLIY